MSFSKKLRPWKQVMKISEISLNDLWDSGARGLILDIDNTISPWHKYQLTKESEAFVYEALSKGYTIVLLSNSSHRKTKALADSLGVHFIAPAFKPLLYSFRKAIKRIKQPPEKIVVIGDQIFTDVWGGNKSGCSTILVKPLTEKELFWTKIMRYLEKIVLKKKTDR